MLTRKGVRDADEAVAEESAFDLDEYMSMSDAKLNKLEKEMDAELAELERIYERKLAQMDSLTRYRFQRRRLLISLLRTRERRERWQRIAYMDVMLPMQAEYIRRKQKELVMLRHALHTGITGGRA